VKDIYLPILGWVRKCYEIFLTKRKKVAQCG